ncbi:MAG: hypothetical protein JJU36_09740 [Phycisphaeraceae bacterium]|nr:hypothetical protein [Phycisphaeraceae bacterium]
MRLHIEPHPGQFEPRSSSDSNDHGHPSFAVQTGHQAWFWHPGILVKLLLTSRLAQQWGVPDRHWVVDHDIHSILTIPIPVRQEEGLKIVPLFLGLENPVVPSGMQPAVEAPGIVERIEIFSGQHELEPSIERGLIRLADTFTNVGSDYPSLAGQVMAVIGKLFNTVFPGQRLPEFAYTTDLVTDPRFTARVRDLVYDAPRLVRHYNQAVVENPEAGLRPLEAGRERVELPLWLLRHQRPRQPIYIDLADHEPQLIDEHGRSLDLDALLEPSTPGNNKRRPGVIAPRALLLTAHLRSAHQGIFIHGRGGMVYDRAMERWLELAGWERSSLCPAMLASADAFLDWSVPVNGQKELRDAIWWRHHLPHNVDRFQPVDDELRQRKRRTIQLLAQPLTREVKAAWFEQLKELNRTLANAFPGALAEADRRLHQARQGVRNQSIAGKRDWPFFHYPDDDLRALATRLDHMIQTPPHGPPTHPIQASNPDRT